MIWRALEFERQRRAQNTVLRDRPVGGSPVYISVCGESHPSILRRRRHRETLPAVAAASLLPIGNDGGFIFPSEEREETSEEDDSCRAGASTRRRGDLQCDLLKLCLNTFTHSTDWQC